MADGSGSDGHDGTAPGVGSTGDALVGEVAVQEWLVVYLKGLAMGTADAIPGVSGGTIALITGIYDRLVGAIAALDPRALLRILDAPGGARVRTLREEVVGMDVHFLAVLGLGVMTGVVTVAQVLEYVMHNLPVPTFAFFFGLIAASAVVLFEEVAVDTRFRIAVGLVGVVGAFLLAGEASAGVGHALPVVALTGTVAISAMLLPGVSGSFLLLAMGQLAFMTSNLNDFVEGLLALLSGGSLDGVVSPGTVVVSFVAGALVGLFTVAHAVRYALSRNRPATLTFLVGLMVGGLRVPGARVYEHAAGPADWLLAVVVAVVGAALVVGIERATGEIGVE